MVYILINITHEFLYLGIAIFANISFMKYNGHRYTMNNAQRKQQYGLSLRKLVYTNSPKWVASVGPQYVVLPNEPPLLSLPSKSV